MIRIAPDVATSSLTVRQMDRGDLDVALSWAEREGWNPGLADADAFFRTDPEGFFIAEFEGRAVGSIAAVRHDEDFGFVGLYAVVPRHRGKGIGLRLWQTAIDRLGDRNIGIDRALDDVASCAKSGFGMAHHHIRFEAWGSPSLPDAGVGYSLVDWDELVAFDGQFFPARRVKFLRRWITQPNSVFRALYDRDRIVGYGVMRPCRVGYKIGPLFAESATYADRLYKSLASRADNAPVYLDVPETNRSALALTARHRMRKVLETARLYNRCEPKVWNDGVFGVTSLEVG